MQAIIKKIKSSNVLMNIGAAFIIKGLALSISLFSMPAYIKYFDNSTILGLWFTILSIVNWMLSFDLGIGNGLRNNLVESITEKNKKTTQEYISSGYIITGLISIIIYSLGTIFIQFANWNNILNISVRMLSSDILRIVIQLAFTGVMLQFFLRLINSILYALQRSSINNFLALITSFSQLLFILLVPSLNPNTNIIMLSVFFVISVNFPLIIATIIIFSKDLKEAKPSLKLYKKEKAIKVISVGGIFFWCQIMFMLITTTNEFFISKITSPSDVVSYQVYNKLFTIIGSLFMLGLTPLWSAITKALVSKDVKWINKVYRNLNYFAILGVLGQFVLILFLQLIVDFWLKGNAIKIDYMNAILFAVYGGLFLYQSILSTIVCGMNEMKIQAIFYTLAVLLKFGILTLYQNNINNWIVIVGVNVLILLPYCMVQPYFIRKSINRKLENNHV
ncbi:MATE family efflux transporter [Vagococcus fluvialis]|uniref:hypothetical protein n=1 Tax=Vagococcus fluvialis TaxID=2738 RepID=UPI001D0B1423|nr:hypothetical protein [Vagococcus fluvialis]UDM78975.1 hypothetical protein K5K97_09660 [Vagococcus fluvialis]